MAAAIAIAVGGFATVGALALMVLFGPSGTLDPGAVMHADGTPGVSTRVHAAVTVPHMFDVALGAVAGGLLAIGVGIAGLVAARRRPTA